MTRPPPASLFSEVIPPGEQDPEYIAIRDRAHWKALREDLESLWERFRPLADSHFVDQFQRRGSFQARVWEMRVGCALLAAGHQVSSEDIGPDFSLFAPPIRVEAIAPSESMQMALKAMRSAPEFVDMPDDDIILRLTGAIAEKHRKFSDYKVAGRIAPTDGLVVAVSGSRFGPGLLDPKLPLLLFSLFGLGNLVATFTPGGGEPSVEFEPSLTRRKPTTGATIDNFLFRSFEHDQCAEPPSEISGILFSDSNFRVGSARFDDFVFIHNPVANVPVSEGFLPFGVEYARRGDAIGVVGDHRSRGAA